MKKMREKLNCITPASSFSRELNRRIISPLSASMGGVSSPGFAVSSATACTAFVAASKATEHFLGTVVDESSVAGTIDFQMTKPNARTGLCNMKAKVTTLADGKTLSFKVDKDKCIGCGMCAKQCPAEAITRTDYTAEGHKLASMAIDTTKCVKCGACMSKCKFGAISKK